MILTATVSVSMHIRERKSEYETSLSVHMHADCAPECLNNGGGFCTGGTAVDCCPFFNNDTGACVDNCTTINPNFEPDEDSVCGEQGYFFL